MKDQAAVGFASYFAACMVLRRAGVRLFRHLHEQLAVAILLATFGCLPARCQDAGNFAIRQVAEAPSSRLNGSFCFLPRGELSYGIGSADPQSTQGRSSDGAFKKTIRRFGKDQAEIYSAPFHSSNLKWDALSLPVQAF
jgi:hypothetical protein